MAKGKLLTGLFIGMIAMTVASISVSFAWYASSNFLRVNPIDIEIKSERQLMLSTTQVKEDYKESLSLEDGDLAYSGVFAPVSSMYSEDWILSRASAPVFYDCARYWGAPGEPIKNPVYRSESFYYTQELYLYADDNVYVTIDTEQTYIKSDEAANTNYAHAIYSEMSKKYPGITVAEIKEKLDQLTKAMRISILIPGDDFYQYYVIDPNKAENDEEVLFGGVLDNAKDLYYDTYSENGQIYETVYGEVNDRSLIVYNEEVESADSELVGETSAFNAKHKKETHRFNYEESYANGMRFKEENAISLSDLQKNPSLIKFPVYFGFANARKIIVSIYIEGWDLRSINSTMGSTFMANLSFKILREM